MGGHARAVKSGLGDRTINPGVSPRSSWPMLLERGATVAHDPEAGANFCEVSATDSP
jgi:hypothetical protein